MDVKPLNREKPNKIYLAYLDGLRGLAALYVVLFHIYEECTYKREMPTFVSNTVKLIAYPQLPVAVFIVLSGYCLMLPVVHSGGKHVPGGVMTYFRKRVWRILPTYYAALLLSLLLLTLALGIQHFGWFAWDPLSINFRPGAKPGLDSIVSHFFLLHNLKPHTAAAINGPMWSLATEWQIYFLFPVLLLPVYRRFGIISLLAISFVIGLGPHYLWPQWPDYSVSPWFVSLFVFGMVAALINFSKETSLIYYRKKGFWGLLTVILWMGLIFMFAPQPVPELSRLFAYLVGISTASLLVYCTLSATEDSATHRPWIVRLFENHYFVSLGKFSYSLYLTHAVVVVLVHQFLLKLHMSPILTFLFLIIVAVPLSLLTAHIFYLKFEKPFIPVYKKQLKGT
ncbi:MAG TPA: acyltransferase [Cyanobacteria bacterium UBA8543]|nr:acyltransferase [Cyanobacteria bacterium UBA8543]